MISKIYFKYQSKISGLCDDIIYDIIRLLTLRVNIILLF